MNNPQLSSKHSIIKLISLFLPLILLFTSCKKNSTEDAVIKPATKQIVFKTEEWKAYLIIGGPGEDSMYYSWTPQLVTGNQYVDKVQIKTKSGSLSTAKLFTHISQNDSGYLFQTGEAFGRPGHLQLWWIQKQLGEKPDADSAVISIKTY